jgi:hypothetical protein
MTRVESGGIMSALLISRSLQITTLGAPNINYVIDVTFSSSQQHSAAAAEIRLDGDFPNGNGEILDILHVYPSHI